MKVTIEERVLHFKQPAGTSRGVYTERRIWLVTVTDSEGFHRQLAITYDDMRELVRLWIEETI